MDRAFHYRLPGVALLIGGLAACGGGAAAPTPQEAAPVLDRVEVTGPLAPERYLEGAAYRLEPGETAQFKAVGWFHDGSSRDITSQATWESSDTNVLSVSGAGLVTARQRGDASVSARLDSRPGSQRVIVLRPDSYVLGGQVYESRNPPVTLDNADLTVLNGPLAGEHAVNRPFVGYRFFGLGGPTTIRVQKAGYQTKDFAVVVSDHQTFDVDLPLLRPRVDLSGTYTLTLTAADECTHGEGILPAEARQRRYSALVSQNGPLLAVELSGGAFVDPMPADHRFPGRIDPFVVAFDVTWGDARWEYGPPRLVEILSTGEVLVVDGSFEAEQTAVSQRGLTGMLDGYFYAYPAGAAPRLTVPRLAWCYSANHRFVLSR